MGEIIGIGEMATRLLKEEGLECGFGVTGFHSEMFYAMFPQYGMRLYTMRHEQAGAYAADGYSGASRKLAMCYGTAGPGVTNMASGIAQAYQNYRPILAICGMHGPATEYHWTLQEAYPADLFRSCSKFAYQINSPEIVPYWIRRACKTARQYPPGPVILAMSPAVVGWTLDTDEYIFHCPREKVAYPNPPAGDPQAVEKAVQMILDAQRPLILSGDGAYWAHAEDELREFVELTQTAVCCRRTSRGSVPEDHLLAVGPGYRGEMLGSADLVVLLGMRDTVTEAHYQIFPTGSYRHDVPYIQVNEAASDFLDFLPTTIQITGNVKSVLRQMIECATELLKGSKPPPREEVAMAIAKAKEDWRGEMTSLAELDKDRVPVTGNAWRKAIGDFIQSAGNVTLIWDSFTGSHFASDSFLATFAGQSLDAGGWSGVGHGIAMGFGVQVAKPGQPVLVIMGDGGMGVGGMEIETCARYKMPVVSIIWNNSRWMAGTYEWLYCQMAGDNRMQQDIKYDEMFSVLQNVHAELCTTPEQIRPALERAFNSGKTAVINVLANPTDYHTWAMGIPGTYYRWFGIERAKDLIPKAYQDLIQPLGGPEGVLEMLRVPTKYLGV